MCGRFVGFRSLDELKGFFPIDKAACEAISNCNVAPSQEILAIAKYEGENWLVKFHWGQVRIAVLYLLCQKGKYRNIQLGILISLTHAAVSRRAAIIRK